MFTLIRHADNDTGLLVLRIAGMRVMPPMIRRLCVSLRCQLFHTFANTLLSCQQLRYYHKKDNLIC